MKTPRDPFEVIYQYLNTKTKFIVERFTLSSKVYFGPFKITGMSENWIYIHDLSPLLTDDYNPNLHGIRRASIDEIQIQVFK